MVERITDPHKPVQVHGTGRLPDGQGVPVRAKSAPKPTRYDWLVFWGIVGAVVLALVLRHLP